MFEQVHRQKFIFWSPSPQSRVKLVGYGSGGGEQQLSHDLSFVIQTYGPHFRPAVNILLVGFGGGGVVLVLVTGVKQSQLLDF